MQGPIPLYQQWVLIWPSWKSFKKSKLSFKSSPCRTRLCQSIRLRWQMFFPIFPLQPDFSIPIMMTELREPNILVLSLMPNIAGLFQQQLNINSHQFSNIYVVSTAFLYFFTQLCGISIPVFQYFNRSFSTAIQCNESTSSIHNIHIISTAQSRISLSDIDSPFSVWYEKLEGKCLSLFILETHIDFQAFQPVLNLSCFASNQCVSWQTKNAVCLQNTTSLDCNLVEFSVACADKHRVECSMGAALCSST